ncbi:prenylcysteine oxidase 1 [Bemisia tabaci]|uniref:prenylcysteine oxidase 1 n=1 Tax=Bemisia tabaci TaxID=7038 RepID=UPI0008F9BAF9|nr:PREDICTED: prenylcysteine oxidase 1-like [Bemisia tabaci]
MYELCCIIMCFITIASGKQIPKVAIIGGGIGGTSTAHFLIDLFGRKNIDIDIYEANKIGGRLATAKVGDFEYETGGSVIHTSNKYMEDLISTLGLRKRSHCSSQENFGLYDGSKFVFMESDWSWVTMIKLAWRYGFSLSKITDNIDTMLSRFARIYELQANHKTFTTVHDMLHAMDPSFPAMMKKTTFNGFVRDGISPKIIDELVMASLLCNYGQDTNVHQFVGSVSMAAVQGSLFSVSGGNKGVAEKVISHHKLNVIHSKVLKVIYEKDVHRFGVNYVGSGKESSTKDYDFVVLAAPLTHDLSKLQCLNLPDGAKKCSQRGTYHRTVSTIVEGKVNSNFFESMKEDELPVDILLTNKSVFFRSFSRIKPVSTNNSGSCGPPVYKVFSPKPLTDQELKVLFKEIKSVQVSDWLAYPEYDEAFAADNFVLYDRFYYLNAIESAASAMEMSAISAKNIALLVHASWTKAKPVEHLNNGRLKDEFR